MEAFETFYESAYSREIMVIVISLLFLIVATRISSAIFSRAAKKSEKNRAQIFFLKHLINAVIIIISVISILMQIEPFRPIVLSLVASSSVVALAVALAGQEVITNLVSGVFLLVFKPFLVGDRVKLTDKNISGNIEEVTLRHTIIRTDENSRIIVPNALMNSAVMENFTLGDDA